MMRLQFFIGVLAIAYVSLAWSDEETHYDRISLSASASEEVQQDELQASVYAMNQDEDAKSTASTVSEKIQKALDIIDTYDKLTVQTGSFNTHPVYRKNKITGWRSRQSIHIKSTNAAKLSQLLGELQHHVHVENIRYAISDAHKAEAEDRLIQRAINHFKQRAQLVTRQMGRSKYRLVTMNILTNQRAPIVRHNMAMAARADTSVAPPIKTGTQQVQVTINATIEVQLKP